MIVPAVRSLSEKRSAASHPQCDTKRHNATLFDIIYQYIATILWKQDDLHESGFPARRRALSGA
jgi:hypothetical protein